MKCFLDTTTDCDPYIASALNPLLEQTLGLFDDRCVDTWCPLEDEPQLCDIQKAQECLAQLQTVVANNDEGACM